MDDREIRLRCIEAAAKTPTVHPNGHASGVQETAAQWAAWVGGAVPGGLTPAQEPRPVLGLPKKK
jgi:hypothetical protein